eukprot:CCRYP_013242-RC/>CCRYP_013242-RC protein AED:0.41 eAED:0.63 QI:0/-1/0/1/-1/0/1/0/45
MLLVAKAELAGPYTSMHKMPPPPNHTFSTNWVIFNHLLQYKWTTP